MGFTSHNKFIKRRNQLVMKKRATQTGNKGFMQRLLSPWPDQNGFSLIELIVVLAILAIMGTFGTPKLLAMKVKSGLRADTRDVYSTFKQAQTEAIKRSESVCILFDTPNAGNYTVFLDNGGATGTGTANNATKDGDEIDLFVKHLHPGGSFTNIGFGGNPGFNSRGLPLIGNVGSVQLQSTGTTLAMQLSLSNAGFVKITVL